MKRPFLIKEWQNVVNGYSAESYLQVDTLSKNFTMILFTEGGKNPEFYLEVQKPQNS